MTEDEELILLAEQAQDEETIAVTIEELRTEIQKKLDQEKTKE